MKSLLALSAMALGLVSVARAEDDNPFKKANTGDWVEFDVESTAQNVKLTGKLKLTVTAKTEKEATLRTSIILEGQKEPAFSQDTKVPLDKPFDVLSASGLPGAADAKAEKLDQKMEKIKVAGKEMECTMTTIKLTAKVMGQDFESQVKVWTNKEIPLTSLAKMEVRSTLADMKMTYAGTGGK